MEFLPFSTLYEENLEGADYFVDVLIVDRNHIT